MRLSEIFRLVWLNLSQNKFKVILTSIGIVAGSATIMMVLAIGTGGREEVAEQFKNLNAGAVDISYEENVVNEKVTLTYEDAENLMLFVPEISDATISYSATASVEGGELDTSSYYTVAGVLHNYGTISNLGMAIGEFLTEENNQNKEKICILGSAVANAVFGSAYNAYDNTLYIDDRAYVVGGVLSEMGSVASGISPDQTVFIPYETGIKYITGNDISPTITVIADDVEAVESVMADVESELKESYPNTAFTISDAGSKMEAASASNETLTLLLISMAVIVFIVV